MTYTFSLCIPPLQYSIILVYTSFSVASQILQVIFASISSIDLFLTCMYLHSYIHTILSSVTHFSIFLSAPFRSPGCFHIYLHADSSNVTLFIHKIPKFLHHRHSTASIDRMQFFLFVYPCFFLSCANSQKKSKVTRSHNFRTIRFN